MKYKYNQKNELKGNGIVSKLMIVLIGIVIAIILFFEFGLPNMAREAPPERNREELRWLK